MSLHETVEMIKKVGLGMAIGLGGTITLFIIIRIGILVKNILYPPKIAPPNYAYGVLPALQFPKNATQQQFSYTLNTLSGTLPQFPDRLNIYPVKRPQPNLLNLNNARSKMAALGFTTPDGNTVAEIPLGNSWYEWDMQDPQTAITFKMRMNTVTFDFNLLSNYLPSLTVLEAQNLSDQDNAIQTAQSYLNTLALFPDDIDLTKTQNPNQTVRYTTYPQLFSIQNNTLIPATSLSKAQVIRVDFYQKDISYELNTGVQGDNHVMQTTKMQLPIVYPNPPYSTMSFWIASGPSAAQVVQADFVHQEIDTTSNTDATYGIKTPQEAFDELKAGKAYIASYNGSSSNILINNIYLAYYLGQTQQAYLMPVIVFEGNDNFMAYVSAVENQWVK